MKPIGLPEAGFTTVLSGLQKPQMSSFSNSGVESDSLSSGSSIPVTWPRQFRGFVEKAGGVGGEWGGRDFGSRPRPRGQALRGQPVGSSRVLL